jgi:hypothetical protein
MVRRRNGKASGAYSRQVFRQRSLHIAKAALGDAARFPLGNGGIADPEFTGDGGNAASGRVELRCQVHAALLGGQTD